MRTSLQHHDRLNLVGALCVSHAGDRIKLLTLSYRQNVSGDEVIAFLRHLLHYVPGPILLLWDNHPIHRRKKVQTFLAQHQHIHVAWFPAYAPELNPVEFVWTQLNERLAGTAPRSPDELRTYVLAAIARTRNSPKRLWACIFASDLPWPH